jgi:hypothetical protein
LEDGLLLNRNKFQEWVFPSCGYVKKMMRRGGRDHNPFTAMRVEELMQMIDREGGRDRRRSRRRRDRRSRRSRRRRRRRSSERDIWLIWFPCQWTQSILLSFELNTYQILTRGSHARGHPSFLSRSVPMSALQSFHSAVLNQMLQSPHNLITLESPLRIMIPTDLNDLIKLLEDLFIEVMLCNDREGLTIATEDTIADLCLHEIAMRVRITFSSYLP